MRLYNRYAKKLVHLKDARNRPQYWITQYTMNISNNFMKSVTTHK